MKCPNCKNELISLETEKGGYVCPKCSSVYHEEDVRKIKEAELIEKDMEIWKETRKYH